MINGIVNGLIQPGLIRGLVAGQLRNNDYLYASSINYFADNNPAVYPKTNAGANAVVMYFPYYVEGDLSSYKFVFDTTSFGPTGEGTLGNEVTLVEAAAIYNGVSYPLRFNGSRSRTMPDGDKNIATDAVPASAHGASLISKGSFIFIKARFTTPALGGNFMAVNVQADAYDTPETGLTLGGISWFYNTATATPGSVDALGAWTFTSGARVGFSSLRLMAPVLVGTFVNQKTIAPLALVDSIGTRYLGVLYNQFLSRTFPFGAMARPGIAMEAFISDTSWQWRLQYCNDVYFYLGPNDFAGLSGSSQAVRQATLESRLESLVALMAGKRVHVSQIMTTSSSTDNWATTANQTETAHWRDTHDAFLAKINAMHAAGSINYVHDVSPMLNESKGGGETVWPVAPTQDVAHYSTVDGIHLSGYGDIVGVSDINNTGAGRFNSSVLMPGIRSASVEIFGVSAPYEPTISIVSVGSSQVVVNVVGNYDGGASQTLTVKYRESGSSGAFSTVSVASGIDETITGLTNAVEYEFIAVASNSEGTTEGGSVTGSPVGESYDANLTSVFDVLDRDLVDNAGSARWQDARGSSIYYDEYIEPPSQSASGAPIVFVGNDRLQGSQTEDTKHFTIVISATSDVLDSTGRKCLMQFGTAGPAINIGNRSVNGTTVIIRCENSFYFWGVTSAQLNTAIGETFFANGSKYVITATMNPTGNAGNPLGEIWVNGVQCGVVDYLSAAYSEPAHAHPAIGGEFGTGGDAGIGICAVQHYSDRPSGSIADIQSGLMTKHSV